MQFTPKTEAEIQEEGLLPAGTYDFQVTEAEDTISKKGSEMIALKLKVFDSNGGHRIIRDWLLEAMAFKLRHFCEATGLLKQYESGNLDALSMDGATGKVEIIVKDDPTYGKQNSVKDYVVSVEPKTLNETLGGDEVPF